MGYQKDIKHAQNLSKIKNYGKMSIILTMIARASDGLPLAASVQDEQVETTPFQNQAKRLFKQLKSSRSKNGPSEASLKTNDNKAFHFIQRSGVSYLALCERSYSRK